MMKPYPSYKDSGVEWIGSIPIDWKPIRLKYIGKLYGGLAGKNGNDFNQDDHPNNRPYIPFTNISDNTYITKNNLGYVVINENDVQNRVEKYDIFFLMSSEDQEGIGKSSILNTEFDELYLNTFCKGFRISENEYYPLFLNYLLNGHSYRELMRVEGRGFTRINLRSHKVNDFQVFVPSKSEQSKIVSFLDHKTKLIDDLINKTEQKIELLKEKRTSLINHCVTKGLDPNVEMKDSSVEWIGEIPIGWNLVSLKHLVSTKITDGPHETPDFVDDGIPFLSVESVQDNKLDFNRKRGFISIEKHKEYSKKCKPQKDDVFLVKSGSTTGKSTIVETDEEFNIWSPLCIIRSNLSKVLPKFTFISIQSDYFRKFVELGWSFGTQPNIGMGVIENLRIIVPSLKEQKEIFEYLDEQTQKIDSTIEKETQRIELLKEYRQSLISEVVTGKIDVRDYDG